MKKPAELALALAFAIAAAVFAADPVFEVASVKPASKGGATSVETEHGRFAWSETLYGFALLAYGIQGCGAIVHDPVRCTRLTGGPDWIHSDSFDIEAKIPAGMPEYTAAQFSSGNAPELQAMLQALLADRFKLQIHHTTKELPIYTLTVAKGGVKAKPAEGSERQQFMFAPGNAGDASESTIRAMVRNCTVSRITAMLGNILGRPVVDRTGLQGAFNFDLLYEPDHDPGDSPMPAAGLGGAGMFEALEKQAGLKLESTKGPVDVIVIDRAEKPSPN